MRNPRLVHYASLAVAFLYILVVGGNQWFFGDDWVVIAPRFDWQPLAPHVGHLTAVPALLFPVLRNAIGLDSYLPFLLVAVFTHLAVAHLVWRILNRVGVGPWIATGLAAAVAVLGAGAENILWAFQFGFMGAISVGLLVILLVDVDRPRWLAVLVLAILCVGFSGTAIPILIAGGVVSLGRHGAVRTAATFGPAAAVFIAWYVAIGRGGAAGIPAVDSWADVPAAVLYAGAVIGAGLGRATPWIGLGVAVAIAIAVWVILTVRRDFRGPSIAAYGMIAGAVVFAALTAWSRSSLGLSGAGSQRYAYLVIVLLMPAIGLGLTAVTRLGRSARVAVSVVVTATVLFNGALLAVEASVQAEREGLSRRVVTDFIEKIQADPDDPLLWVAPADPAWAPDLLGSDVRTLLEWGQLR